MAELVTIRGLIDITHSNYKEHMKVFKEQLVAKTNENGNCANRVLATVPILTKGDRPDFIAKHKHLFEKLTDEEATNILIAIWNFGNERWNAGYNQGYRNPDFD